MDLALNYKPGLFGVHYYDPIVMAPNCKFEDFIKIERDYLIRKAKSPRSTDTEYLLVILHNIIFANVRSR
jgi:hypothetical protein